MATVALQFPPSNTVLPGTRLLPTAPFPHTHDAQSSLPSSDLSPRSIVEDWLSAFKPLLDGEDALITKLFLEESYWRDLLCMTWDFRTLQGPERISEFIQSSPRESRLISLSLDTSSALKVPQAIDLGSLKTVQAFLKVETHVGRGEGLVRLVADTNDGGRWKVLTLFTTLSELKGHEATVGNRRPQGTGSGQKETGRNWKDRLIAQQNFEGDRQPTVLILGAGHSGLCVAARLKQLGVEALIIDQNPRIGDNWRNRYHQLVLHDPVWYDQMPYLSFPPNWPVFTPKDKLADWFEYYAGVMELNVWTSTTLEKSEWSEDTRQWTVSLARERDGKTENRILHPRHVILATGHSGEPYFPSNIAGIDDFKGDRLIHSSQFTKPEKGTKGKKAVVVGCCNSGHDIAREYLEHRYDVTMVQRSSTFVVTVESVVDVALSGLYCEDGPPTDDADIINLSIPNPILKTLQIQMTAEMARRDGPLLEGLAAAGFAVDSGPDGAGLFMKYLSRGGGYYIDVGTSQLIADRKIKIKQGHTVKCVKPHSLVLADESELEADEIVFATGYQNMRETARKVFGDGLADRVTDVWGFDDEGEIRGMWRGSGHPGFWFFGGNLALCRFFSKSLALQIKAIEVGLMTGPPVRQ